jgi:hypothetical protein
VPTAITESQPKVAIETGCSGGGIHVQHAGV